MIRKNKGILRLNKPTYVKIFLLDLSKVLMHEFRYNDVKNKCGKKLLFTDTDSLMHEIET